MVLLDNSIQCIEIQNVNLEYGVFERFGCFFSHTHDAWVSYRICSKDICSIHKNPLSYSGHPKNGTHARTHTHTHFDKTYSTFCAKFMIMNVPLVTKQTPLTKQKVNSSNQS